ncbi:hypothetical protein F5Y05DRAFT_405051 [Hypoxylon sp. FL0543]|nr:hypothetical protein F5Y05DRAFT_405051 [Hypoxylon sp. FL0543]
MNVQFHPQSGFAPAYNFQQANGMQYVDNQYPVQHGFPGFQYLYTYQQPRTHLLADRNGLADPKTESKPRLSKEEVDKLEKVFQENPKPSSSVKAQLADGLGLERPRINNWFQNRRAKAKQERKQEEYHARTKEEKNGSQPVSPDGTSSSGVSELAGDSVRRRAQPSSAAFPNLNSTSEATDAFDNEDCDNDSPDSDDSDSSPAQAHSIPHQDEACDNIQSPLSLEFSQADATRLAQEFVGDNYSSGLSPYLSSPQSFGQVGRDEESTNLANNLPSPDQQCATNEHHGSQYSTMMETSFSTTTVTPFLQSQPTFETPGLNGSSMGSIYGHDESACTPVSDGQTMMRQGIPTPTDSFKSPPPPANIASRRNIPRPAALQTASLRSRSYNLGYGPRPALDATKRIGPSSPASAMRRISSTAGSMQGRIQKSSSAPRSPMFFNNRNAEALLQYHARSPVGHVTAAFPGAAPPTPMTPAVIEQQGIREPTVSSACSDDNSFLLGGSLSASIMHEFKADDNLKTPPTTPGLLNHFGTQNYTANPYGTRVELHADQPLLTPYFQAEFPDLSMRNVPSYAELTDGSLPTTPLYPNLMSSIQDQNSFGHNAMGNTQFDWDANESVNSSKSSPNYPRSKQIQFTQNMTPQDYNSHQDK